MKKKKIIILLLTIVAIPFLIFWSPRWYRSYQHSQHIERRIQEVQAIDIDEEFRENIKNNDLRAVVILGEGRFAPGLNEDLITHKKKYGTRIIEGTSDVYSKFQSIAVEYAKTYNQKLNKYMENYNKKVNHDLNPPSSDLNRLP